MSRCGIWKVGRDGRPRRRVRNPGDPKAYAVGIHLAQRALILAAVLLLVGSACSGGETTPPSPAPSEPPVPTTTSGPVSSPTTSTLTSAPPSTQTRESSPTPVPTSPPVLEQSADVIFYNGPVLTMEADLPEAAALAVRGDDVIVGPSIDATTPGRGKFLSRVPRKSM